MQIICSNCKTEYQFKAEDIDSIKKSPVKCKECSNMISLAECPECGFFYSVSCSGDRDKDFEIRCNRCSSTFQFRINAVKNAIRLDQINPSAELSNSVKYNSNDSADYSGEKTISFKKIISLLSDSFSLKKTAVSCSGIIIMGFLIMNYIYFENIFFNITGNMNAYIRSFLMIIQPVFTFSILIITISILSKMTFKHNISGEKTSAGKIFLFMVKIFPRIFAGIYILLAISNSAFILFNSTPVSRPLLFSLFFLPVYLSLISVFFIIFSGLFFYPPVIAFRKESFPDFIIREKLNIFAKSAGLAAMAGILLILSGGLTYIFLLGLNLNNSAANNSLYIQKGYSGLYELISSLIFSGDLLFVKTAAVSIIIISAGSSLSIIATFSSFIYSLSLSDTGSKTRPPV